MSKCILIDRCSKGYKSCVHRKKCSKICNNDYHLIKRNYEKYFRQSSAIKITLPSNKKTNDSLSNLQK